MSNPKKVTIAEEFSVIGLQTRTQNADEFNPEKAKIMPLWMKFYGSSLISHLDQNDPCIYGVYSNYESDHNGLYSLTVGVNTKCFSDPDSKFHQVTIQPGSYLIFEAQGKQPESIIATWQEIWTYFASPTNPRWTYTTAFEKYISEDKVEIYIAVENNIY